MHLCRGVRLPQGMDQPAGAVEYIDIELNCVLMLNWIAWNKTVYAFNSMYCPVGCGRRIHRQLLCRGIRPPHIRVPRYKTKQSDAEAPVMLELWVMRSTHSLPSLPDPLYPGLVAPDRVLSTGQIELNWDLFRNLIAWNRTILTFKLCT